MHNECLRHDTLMRVFERLGRTKPQIFDDQDDVELNEKDEEGLVLPQSTNVEEKDVDPLPLFVGPNPPTERLWAREEAGKESLHELFEVSTELQPNQNAWKINDLRTSVSGGSKAWLEQAFCLLCSRPLE